MAEGDDVCLDAMSYALALFGFMLGAKAGLGAGEREALRAAVSGDVFLKVAMRLWRGAGARHVAGTDEEDAVRGVGYVVTAFVQAVAGCGEGYVEGACSGRGVIVGMGDWFITFWLVRMSAIGVGADERARLVTVVWACCEESPVFGRECVWDDLAVVTAVARSARVMAEEAVSALDLGDEDAEDEEDGSGPVGANCEANDGTEASLEVSGKSAGIGREARLLIATRAASCAFAHVRFFLWSLRNSDSTSAGRLRRRRFLRRYCLRSWFMDALDHCADLSYALAGFEIALGPGCSKYIQAPCLRSSLSFIVWKVAEWLSTDSVTWKTNPGGTVLDRRTIWRRLRQPAAILCDATAAPLQALCALSLIDIAASGRDGSKSSLTVSSVEKRYVFCEWCFASGSEGCVDLKACGGCGETWYCGSDHMRLHWKSGHKRACLGSAKATAHGAHRLIGKALTCDASTGSEAISPVRRSVELALLGKYGDQLAIQGLALSVDSEAKTGKALHFGQLLSMVQNFDVNTGLLDTCRKSGFAFIPVILLGGEHSPRPQGISIRRLGEVGGVGCAQRGCESHDNVCTALN